MKESERGVQPVTRSQRQLERNGADRTPDSLATNIVKGRRDIAAPRREGAVKCRSGLYTKSIHQNVGIYENENDLIVMESRRQSQSINLNDLYTQYFKPNMAKIIQRV